MDERIVVYTEVTPTCNNKCYFCPIDKLSRKGQISNEVEDRVVSFLANTPHKKFRVFPHLLGEPLLFRRLERYLGQLNLPHVELWIATNGILLTPERLRSLHAAGLRNIWFSMFYTNKEDYRRNTGSEFFETAYSNLLNLLAHHSLFRRIHVVTFACEADRLAAQLSQLPNVTFQQPRRIEEWRYDGKPRLRSLFFMTSRLRLAKSICITTEGNVAFDWKDYNAEASPGNILSLTDYDILNGYYSSGAFNRPREQFASVMHRLFASNN